MSALRSPRTVWVVDDSGLDAERARRVLSREFAVDIFHDGSAALERLSAGEVPDVIVLDWVMPGVSGLEVCRFVRASDGPAQKVGILLLTVQRDVRQIVEGLSAGANDFVSKPYEDEELRARVAALVRTRTLVEQLERTQAENRRLLETTPDPLLVVDAVGQLTFVNEQAAGAFGVPREQLLTRALGELVPELSHARRDVLAGAEIVHGADVTIGERRFSPTLRTLHDDGVSTVIALRDVTERRLLDERRLDFYSIVAHDLRTPLNAMSLRLGMMLTSKDAREPPRLEENLGKLELRLRSLVEMLNDFLELASLEGASFRMERDQVDLGALVAQVAEECEPLLERQRHDFSLHSASPELAIVRGDARRLAQAIGNLLSNAIKFTSPGGSIGARLEVEPSHVLITITDTGSGIPEAAQARLFERYVRAENKVGGTGLGLMIVREIVEAHGGAVGVESQLGQGSRFWVRLPRSVSTNPTP
ncbi:MAG: ATP-binding protein [Polyangiales bacterium]